MEPIDGKKKYYTKRKSAARVFWGIIFLLCAAAVIASQFGILGGVKLGFWSVIVCVVLLLILVGSIVHVSWFGIFFSLGFAFLFFQDLIAEASGLVQIANMSVFGVLAIALLLSIGFTILFRKQARFEKWKESGSGEHFESVINGKDGSDIFDRTSFGSKIRYVNTDNFKNAVIECSFGAVKFYFDNARIAAGEKAEIVLHLSFSAAELYIPKNWRLADNLRRSGSGMEEKNSSLPNDDSPLVVLSGEASFSGITILYI